MVTLRNVTVVVSEYNGKHIFIVKRGAEHSPWRDEVVTAKTVTIDSKNRVRVIGQQDQFAYNSEYVKSPDPATVHPESFKLVRRWWQKRPRLVMNEGWVRLKKTLPYDKTFINYTVEIDV